MPRFLIRIVAALLVPCLLADPITVMGSIGPVGAVAIQGDCPQSNVLFTSQALAPVPGTVQSANSSKNAFPVKFAKKETAVAGLTPAPPVLAANRRDWTKPRKIQQRRTIFRSGVYLLPIALETERQELDRKLGTHPFLEDEDYVELIEKVDAIFRKYPQLRSFHRSTELVRDPQFIYLLAYWVRRGAEDPGIRRWLGDYSAREEVPDIPPSAMEREDQQREADHQYALLLKFEASAHQSAAYWALKLAALNEADRESILGSLLEIRERVNLDEQKRLVRIWPNAWGFRLWRGIPGIENPSGGFWRSYIPAYHSNSSNYTIGYAKPAGHVISVDIPLTDVLELKTSHEDDKHGHEVLEFVARPGKYRIASRTTVQHAPAANDDADSSVSMFDPPAAPSSAEAATEGRPAGEYSSQPKRGHLADIARDVAEVGEEVLIPGRGFEQKLLARWTGMMGNTFNLSSGDPKEETPSAAEAGPSPESPVPGPTAKPLLGPQPSGLGTIPVPDAPATAMEPRSDGQSVSLAIRSMEGEIEQIWSQLRKSVWLAKLAEELEYGPAQVTNMKEYMIQKYLSSAAKEKEIPEQKVFLEKVLAEVVELIVLFDHFEYPRGWTRYLALVEVDPESSIGWYHLQYPGGYVRLDRWTHASFKALIENGRMAEFSAAFQKSVVGLKSIEHQLRNLIASFPAAPAAVSSSHLLDKAV